MFHAEIQNSCQNDEKTFFWQKVEDDSGDTVRSQTLIKIALSRTVCEI